MTLPAGSRRLNGVLVGLAAASRYPFTVHPVAPILIGLFALTIGIGSWIRGASAATRSPPA
jgi:hypothetical protein